MRILWPEEVAAEIIRNFRHTLDTGEPYFSKDFIKHRANKEQVEGYEWELHRITMPDGTFGVTCYYYDATTLRNAECALQQSKAWPTGQKEALQATFNGAPLAASLSVLARTAVEHVGQEARCGFYIADHERGELRHVVGMSEDFAECVAALRSAQTRRDVGDRSTRVSRSSP
jgi:hypothetical protein